MLEIFKLIAITLAMTTNTSADISTKETLNPYAGTWEWESTAISGRAGTTVSSPETTKLTKQIVITEDYKVKVYENGNLTCEDDLTVTPLEIPNGVHTDAFSSECLKGSFGIEDGILNHYQYLGCPSSRTTYTLVK